jgi:hypothetical protein
MPVLTMILLANLIWINTTDSAAVALTAELMRVNEENDEQEIRCWLHNNEVNSTNQHIYNFLSEKGGVSIGKCIASRETM